VNDILLKDQTTAGRNPYAYHCLSALRKGASEEDFGQGTESTGPKSIGWQSVGSRDTREELVAFTEINPTSKNGVRLGVVCARTTAIGCTVMLVLVAVHGLLCVDGSEWPVAQAIHQLFGLQLWVLV
jgi:hypothetical protein